MKISTISGQYLDLENPQNYKFTVEEIANNLSNISRFTGNTNRHYSVAEHSVFVSLLVPEEYSRSALFHDAAEAFIGDIATPIKVKIPDIKEIEDNLLREISKQLNFTWYGDLVHHFDKILTLSEGKYFMPNFDVSDQKGYQAIDFGQIANLFHEGEDIWTSLNIAFQYFANNQVKYWDDENPHFQFFTRTVGCPKDMLTDHFRNFRNRCLEQIDAIEEGVIK